MQPYIHIIIDCQRETDVDYVEVYHHARCKDRKTYRVEYSVAGKCGEFLIKAFDTKRGRAELARIALGRATQMATNKRVKLTEIDVIAIRHDKENTCRELADMFGVSKSLISAVKTGKVWKHPEVD